MNDVRRIFDELLTGPVPPMASSEVMLATARQAERRRRRGVLAGGASGLAVVALAVPVGIGAAGGPAPEPGPAAAETPTAEPSDPVGGVRDGADLLDALAATLPAGLTIRRDPAGDDVRFSEVPDVDAIRPGMGLRGVRLLDAAAVVYVGNQAGEIGVSLVDGRSALDPQRRTRQPRLDELCPVRASPPPEKADAEPEPRLPCRTLPVGGAGLPVRILGPGASDGGPVDGGAAPGGGPSGSGDGAAPGGARSGADAVTPNPPGTDCVIATRYAPGVEVALRWCPAVASLPLAGPVEPVTGAVFTDERLAAIVAAPALLPASEGGR
ncbi:hypothetical protein C6361_29930 [Plantactinospora sp. BC1]|uniref:hypothetical protein n=1 Tax=Plantactinospora sp. BC1 TaxID=2108470 RepID=UPI000D16D77A|nr:hypothetical protein [Plantactinospora sp. BC1]AVT32976.1 hypothetical protein C6361_29930 [Plantactinospora sp. BC1]